jgi:prolyl oligopeptidase PreP (S9A serine peptidase family)
MTATSDDLYRGLENNESAMKFVEEANKFCLVALGDPTESPRYSKILDALQADERIPFVSKMGKDGSGKDEFYNLWKDVKVRRISQ